MDDLVVLYTTWPDAETAEAFARLAVEQRLAACANVLAPMRSIYRWDGELQAETETPMLLKTTAAAAGRLKDLVLTHHPYDTPCVLGLRTDAENCNPEYTSWATGQVD